MDQFNWIKGLDQSGWVAAALFVVFFVIAALTIAMMLRLNAQNKKIQKKKSPKNPQSVTPKPTRPAAEKTAVKKTDKKNDDSNPLEEAEVFLTYGLNKQAIDLLEKYLEKHPSDQPAVKMLAKAQTNL